MTNAAQTMPAPICFMIILSQKMSGLLSLYGNTHHKSQRHLCAVGEYESKSVFGGR